RGGYPEARRPCEGEIVDRDAGDTLGSEDQLVALPAGDDVAREGAPEQEQGDAQAGPRRKTCSALRQATTRHRGTPRILPGGDGDDDAGDEQSVQCCCSGPGRAAARVAAEAERTEPHASDEKRTGDSRDCGENTSDSRLENCQPNQRRHTRTPGAEQGLLAAAAIGSDAG